MLFATACLAGSSGCTHRAVPVNELTDRRASVTVTNRHRHDVDVSVVIGVNRIRLGHVRWQATRVFRLAADIDRGAMQFHIACRAGLVVHTTEDVAWVPQPHAMELSVEPQLSLSRVVNRR